MDRTVPHSVATGPPHGRLTRDPMAAFLPPCFFAVAVASFASALVAAPFLLDEVAAFFYQPHVLALTHVLTVGWVSLTIQGVLYRYVPGLTKQPIPHPRLAVVQGATFALGGAGLVAGFWVHRWGPVAMSAGVLVASACLLCANLWPMLRASPERGVAEVGIMLSTAFLVAAAMLGMLLAIDKSRPVLRGSLLTNLAAHVHLAAVGWVGATIVALSFRFLPAFLMPTVDLTRIARRLVVALALAVATLAGLLLAQSDVARAAAGALAALVLVYVALLLRLVTRRRMPMDWTAWHAVASAGWVAVAALAGTVLVVVGGNDVVGTRIAAAYGVAGIVGWMSNLIVGVSYKLFPGFVAAARTQLGRPAVPMAVLRVPAQLPPIVFAGLNVGVVAIVLGILVDVSPAVLLGGTLLAATGILYAIGTERTLLFTVREPRGEWGPLSVLP
jgi:hypothetical protein